MKKKIIACVCLLFLSSCMLAQNIQELKKTYNTHHFKSQPGDPYNPTLTGFVSYLLPGMGHILCKEYERGLCFTGAYLGFMVLNQYASSEMDHYETFHENYPVSNRYRYLQKMMIGGLIGFTGTYIWSIIDAVQVAKLKNLYHRDSDKNVSEIQLNIQPYIEPVSLQNKSFSSIGLSLKATF